MRVIVTDQDSGSLKGMSKKEKPLLYKQQLYFHFLTKNFFRNEIEITFPFNTNTSDKIAPQPTSIYIYGKAGFGRHVQAISRVGHEGQWVSFKKKKKKLS